MKKIIGFITCLIISQNSFSQTFKYQEYINQFASLAISEMDRSGVPASITLAQGILESGSGKSYLAIESNNHFGIKCKTNYEGKVIFIDDDKKDDCFRVYENVLDSYKDHSEFLKSNQRYAFLFELKKTNYKAWAKGLKKAGYATNPKYAKLLIDIIEDNKLYLLDKNLLDWEKAFQNSKEPIVVAHQETKPKPKSTDSSTPNIDAIRDKFDENETPLLDKLKEREKYYIKHQLKNGATFIYAKEGDTYKTIKERHDVWESELRKYNEKIESPTYKEGEMVFVRPKKKKAKHGYYNIKKGETLYSISQKFGVKQKHILKANGLNSKNDIFEGMRINLK
jgi:LysM repeat protein